jgi:hypothetical protein
MSSMAAATATAFGDLRRWQSALAVHASAFSCLAPGARIGLVAEGALAGAGCAGSSMLIWQATEQGLSVQAGTFPGFEHTDVDLLMAADEVALASMDEALEDDVLATLRRLIREGSLLFFARKTRRDLDEAGYEELLEQLGFAFMGACR